MHHRSQIAKKVDSSLSLRFLLIFFYFHDCSTRLSLRILSPLFFIFLVYSESDAVENKNVRVDTSKAVIPSLSSHREKD